MSTMHAFVWPTANAQLSDASTRQNEGTLNSSKKILWMTEEDLRVIACGGRERSVTEAFDERTTGSEKKRR